MYTKEQTIVHIMYYRILFLRRMENSSKSSWTAMFSHLIIHAILLPCTVCTPRVWFFSRKLRKMPAENCSTFPPLDNRHAVFTGDKARVLQTLNVADLWPSAVMAAVRRSLRPNRVELTRFIFPQLRTETI